MRRVAAGGKRGREQRGGRGGGRWPGGGGARGRGRGRRAPGGGGGGGGVVLRLSGPCLALWFQALVVDLGLCRGQGGGMGLGWGVSGLGLGCGWFWFWQSQAWLRAALSGMFMFIDEHVVF